MTEFGTKTYWACPGMNGWYCETDTNYDGHKILWWEEELKQSERYNTLYHIRPQPQSGKPFI